MKKIIQVPNKKGKVRFINVDSIIYFEEYGREKTYIFLRDDKYVVTNMSPQQILNLIEA